MTKFTAKIQNAEHQHHVTLSTGGNEHTITIPSKATGFGSSMNGGEALLLALATCYCNDIYREAQKQSINVKHVFVEVEADQDGQAGHVMENIVYHVTVEADAPQETIEALIRMTDTVAEIQNTLRQANAITLGQITARSNPSA